MSHVAAEPLPAWAEDQDQQRVVPLMLFSRIALPLHTSNGRHHYSNLAVSSSSSENALQCCLSAERGRGRWSVFRTPTTDI